MTKHELGQRAEREAATHLSRHGLGLVECNYHCRMGEIDLVMRDGGTLVFVEVRYRGRGDYGSAAASIDVRKRRRIVNAARHYLQRHRTDSPVRFDVVAIDGGDSMEWIRSAFDAGDYA